MSMKKKQKMYRKGVDADALSTVLCIHEEVT